MSGPIWILVRKELLVNLRTARLAVIVAFTVVLCVLAAIMGSLEYSRNVRAYEQANADLQRRLEETTAYAWLSPHFIVPPQPIQILCRGLVQGAAQRFDVNLSEYSLYASPVGAPSADDLLPTLARVDFVAVVSLVLSFLAVVLGFDAVSGEREQGTLRLLLSHAVSRGQLVAAKILGGVLSLTAALSVAFVASLLILQTNPDVHFATDDWLRLGLLFLLTCLFLAEVFALSVFVSVCAQRAATSLIICLFGWLVLGAGFASALPALARHTTDWPPFEEFLRGRDAEWDRHNAQMAAWNERNPPPPRAYLVSLRKKGMYHYVHPRGQAWLEKRAAFEFDLYQETADRVRALRWHNQQPLALQQLAVDDWSIVSPVAGYRVLAKWLARSTLDDMFEVARHGFRYRRTFISYLRETLASRGWRRYTTSDPPGTPGMIPAPAEVTPDMLAPDSEFMRNRLAWAEARWKQDHDDPRRRLDLTGLPEVGPGWQRTLSESVRRMTPGLVVMLLTLGLAVVLTVRLFQRYRLN